MSQRTDSRIPFQVCTAKAEYVIQLAGELEVHSEGEDESDYDSEEEFEDQFREEYSAPEEIILLPIELGKAQQNGATECQSLAQWLNAKANPTPDDLQASTHYLLVLAQHLDSIAKADEMLLLRQEIDGTNRVIVPISLIGEVF